MKKQLRAIWYYYVFSKGGHCRNCGRPEILDCIEDALCGRIDRFVILGLGDPKALVEEAMKTLPRIMATFQPQAWISNYAVNIDGEKTFDCTEEILRMSAREIQDLDDDQNSTDDLLPDEVRGDHNGPFYVAVRDKVNEFFAKMNLAIDERSLRDLRKMYGVRKSKEAA
jgi:hypothetical protein